jgi:hypothetical protein
MIFLNRSAVAMGPIPPMMPIVFFNFYSPPRMLLHVDGKIRTGLLTQFAADTIRLFDCLHIVEALLVCPV